ncbi:MAG TPA: fluoride efflux transporter CrcB [Anaeromyxobacteraceae bacterium]|nr:fluoride efflux transporter CrcB [Anaeromyxobacteraceae bacterium]
MKRFFLICFGGALGTGGRYLLSTWVAQTFGSGFPLGTLLINISGSFIISVVMELSLSTGAISQDARLFLTTGMMGGYTTYSSFNYETLKLASQGAYQTAALYVSLTLVGATVAGYLGLVAVRELTSIGIRFG